MFTQEDQLYFEPALPEHISREREKGRQLRNSQWWKNQLGRGRCYYCGAQVHPRQLTMDHVVPVVRGGCSTRSNVVPCCKDCNSAKKNLVPSEWQEHLERLKKKVKK